MEARCTGHCFCEKDELTNDCDCEGAVGLVPGAVARCVGDGLLPDGEELGGYVDGLHLHHHLEEQDTENIKGQEIRSAK